MNPYEYKTNSNDSEIKLVKTARKWQYYRVSFPSAHPTCHDECKTVRGDYFKPRTNGHTPLAILIHGLGDRSVLPLKALARSLSRKGIACFILYLVLHSSRMPPRPPGSLTSDDWFENYRISVIDVRQVIDWAETRAEIDPTQIGAVGISLGGFITAIAMGVDQRIKAGVMVASGGNLEKIAFLSKTLSRSWGFKRDQAKFNAQQQRYARYLDEVSARGWENVESPEDGFLIDAMTYARYLRDRPLLMINAHGTRSSPNRQRSISGSQAAGPLLPGFPAATSASGCGTP